MSSLARVRLREINSPYRYNEEEGRDLEKSAAARTDIVDIKLSARLGELPKRSERHWTLFVLRSPGTFNRKGFTAESDL